MKIIDLHCDTIPRIINSEERCNLKKNNFHVDIEKLEKSAYLAQFFAMFIYMGNGLNPLEECLKSIDRFYCEIEANKDKIALATNYYDMEKNRKEGKISAYLTIEEGGVLKGNIGNLRNFYRLGVRLMTLLWNLPNEIGYPNCEEKYRSKGLNPFGEEVVHEMNKLGMIIDVSHLSDVGFYDVSRLSTKPFIASHSNARSIKNHSRNLTDDMIRILAKKGGVCGINYASLFLGDDEVSRVEDMIKHINHIVNVGGIDVVSLGSDYDGISCELEIKNAGEMDKLIFALKKEGYCETSIDKILYKNAKRIIKEVMR